MRHLPLAALVSLAGLMAAAPARAANADCFCARASGGGGSAKPYEVVRLNKPACANVPYKSNGKPPWQNGVPACPNSMRTRPQGTSPSSPKASDEMMRRCFCHKQVKNGGIQQFKVVSYATVPECKGLSYTPKEGGPWENTLFCEAAENCADNVKKCKKKLDKATKRLSDKDPMKVMQAQNDIVTLSKRCQEIDKACYVDGLK